MNQESIFEKVKARASVSEVVRHFGGLELNRAHMANCPFHSERTASFSVKESDGLWKCFGCGASGDAIDFVAKIKEIEPYEAAKEIAAFYGIEDAPHGGKTKVDKIPVRNANTNPDANLDAPRKGEIKAYIERCARDAELTDFFTRRAISADTVKKFCLGYDAERQAAVFPYSSRLDYYQARSVNDKKFFKPKTEDAGPEPLYLGDNIRRAKGGVVFVVESPICALSIIQCGGIAIALGGTGGVNKLAQYVRDSKSACVFALCLDNDAAGQKAGQDLANQLFEFKGKFIVRNIAGEYKDPNELLVTNSAQLSANVKEAIAAAKREFSRLKSLFSAREIQAERINPIRWIVQDLLPEGLSLLGAPSKYGKSWMMMQLCAAVTRGLPFLEHKTVPCECVYISLEDSKRRFQSRLNKVLNNETAPHGFYGMVQAQTMATGLFEQLSELMETHPKIGLIIIDTFQKVRGGQARNETVYGADYREMAEVKEFADKHGICVLLVHHLRKQDDDGDVFNRINGSMALMGASDTSWVLSRKKRDDVNTTLTVTGRDVDDNSIIIAFDKTTVTWNLVGNAEDEAARLARAAYESDPVIKTIKALVEKQPTGWQGNCSEIKLQIYEQTGVLFTGSPDAIGRTVNKYLDRLAADGITHTDARGKRHLFAKRQPTLWSGYDDRRDD